MFSDLQQNFINSTKRETIEKKTESYKIGSLNCQCRLFKSRAYKTTEKLKIFN